eukprot:4614529-Amphidinium_carterae.1
MAASVLLIVGKNRQVLQLSGSDYQRFQRYGPPPPTISINHAIQTNSDARGTKVSNIALHHITSAAILAQDSTAGSRH